MNAQSDAERLRVIPSPSDPVLDVGDQRAATVHAILAKERAYDLQRRLRALALAQETRGDDAESILTLAYVSSLNDLVDYCDRHVARHKR